MFPRTSQTWRFLFFNDDRDLVGLNVSNVFRSIAFMILIDPQTGLFESATSRASDSFVISDTTKCSRLPRCSDGTRYPSPDSVPGVGLALGVASSSVQTGAGSSGYWES